MKKYYLDTCIWRDFYENRFGKTGRPLGKYATELFLRIIKNKDKILFLISIIKELRIAFSDKEIENKLNFLFLSGILEEAIVKKEDYNKAKEISNERNVPLSDVLHAIIARNNNAILISQDKHFQQLKDIANVKKPEEV